MVCSNSQASPPPLTLRSVGTTTLVSDSASVSGMADIGTAWVGKRSSIELMKAVVGWRTGPGSISDSAYPTPKEVLTIDQMTFIEVLSLERALAGYARTVVAVWHDRWFRHSFDRFIEFSKDGTVAELQSSRYEDD